MSLCIAATAASPDGAKHIFAALDRKISTDTASAENIHKFEILPHQLFAMYAGSIPRAHELLQIYRESLQREGFTWADPLESLRKAPRIHKRRLAEAYSQSRLAISYDRLLTSGRDELDGDLRRRILTKIDEMTLDAQIIICGFDPDRKPHIYKFDWEEVTEVTNFACIGSGASAAEQSLYRRVQSEDCSVSQTIYNVWEAKKFGELAPTVGLKTQAVVLSYGWLDDEDHTSFRIISPDHGVPFLNGLYARFGPQRVQDFDLPEGFFT